MARTQQEDLAYGAERERIIHPRLEKWLGVPLEKLGKYHTMDWKELPSDEEPPWWLELKARKFTYEFCEKNYRHKGEPTVVIGKHKIDFVRYNGGNGIILIDFTDRLMYWVVNEEEYATFAIQKDYVRHARIDYIDKPADIIHIPLRVLREVPM